MLQECSDIQPHFTSLHILGGGGIRGYKSNITSLVLFKVFIEFVIILLLFLCFDFLDPNHMES